MKLALAAVLLLLTASGLWAQAEAVEPIVSRPAEDRGGPSLLSRAGFSSVRGEYETLTFRPYAAVEAVYGSGLGTTTVDAQGTRVLVDAYGVTGRYGVAGRKQWKKTDLELDYRGGFSHYSEHSFYDGADNSLLLSVTHQINKRVSVQFDQEAAIYNRSFNLPAAFGSSMNGLASSLTGNELFDSPTGMLMSMGRVIFQKTARLSMSAGGAGYLMRRRSAALMGMNGYLASGDVAYRLSRFSTIGVEYQFMHFDFTNMFGASDAHNVAMNYSVRMGRNWEMALRLGGYRVNIVRLTQVKIDPALAALLGQSYTVGIMDRTTYAPNGDLRLTRTFRRGAWSAGVSRRVVPGSDVYLTSKSDMAQTSFSYDGSRRVAVFGNLSYTRYASLSQQVGRYQGYGGGGGVSVRLSRSFSLVGRVNSERREVKNSSLDRVITQATVGIAWSPGEYPLAIW